MIAIVILLLGIAAAAFTQVTRFARGQAASAAVRNVSISVEQFQQEFGFVVPLMHDGASMSVARPYVRSNATGFVPATVSPMYQDENDADRLLPAVYGRRLNALFLRGRSPESELLQDDPTTDSDAYDATELAERWELGSADWQSTNQRYSKLSLTTYLLGVHGGAVDGEPGPGFREVLRTGVFNAAGRRVYEPMFDASLDGASIDPAYFDDAEFAENGATLPMPEEPTEFDSALVDANGKALRYYRWEHEETIRGTDDLNIPAALLDPIVVSDFDGLSDAGRASADLTGDDAGLRAATWAIVGAGPNGLFGTEAIGTIRAELGLSDGVDEAEARRQAWQDNVIEAGR
ncbi:MAG: hypothetical protein AAF281_00945 [Pseudomonadota bacterium]